MTSNERNYKGCKYTLNKCGDVIHYHTEKLYKLGKKQERLNAKTIQAADKEVHKIIDKILKKRNNE